MPIPAPEKSKLPLPVTLPPPFDMPLRLKSTSFEPPNAPRMLTDVSDMPVTGLDRRATTAMTDPRMMGWESGRALGWEGGGRTGQISEGGEYGQKKKHINKTV